MGFFISALLIGQLGLVHAAPDPLFTWRSLIGRPVSFAVRTTRGDQSVFSGVLEGIDGDLLKFGGFLVEARRVIPESIQTPVMGDLIQYHFDDYRRDRAGIDWRVGIFDRVDGESLILRDDHFRVSQIVRIELVQPGDVIKAQFVRPSADLDDPRVQIALADYSHFAERRFTHTCGDLLAFEDGYETPASHVYPTAIIPASQSRGQILNLSARREAQPAAP